MFSDDSFLKTLAYLLLSSFLSFAYLNACLFLSSMMLFDPVMLDSEDVFWLLWLVDSMMIS